VSVSNLFIHYKPFWLQLRESFASFLAVKKIIRTLAPYILVKNFSAK